MIYTDDFNGHVTREIAKTWGYARRVDIQTRGEVC
jgi:hypothetical protein